jgi:hypothetical protein
MKLIQHFALILAWMELAEEECSDKYLDFLHLREVWWQGCLRAAVSHQSQEWSRLPPTGQEQGATHTCPALLRVRHLSICRLTLKGTCLTPALNILSPEEDASCYCITQNQHMSPRKGSTDYKPGLHSKHHKPESIGEEEHTEGEKDARAAGDIWSTSPAIVRTRWSQWSAGTFTFCSEIIPSTPLNDESLHPKEKY